MRKYLILLFAALCISSTPAKAAPEITPEGATRLQAVFDSMLRDQTKIMNSRGRGKLVQQGHVIVEAAREFYAVTLPYLQIKYPNKSQLELGIISINAVPHDTQTGQWKITLALPATMTLNDAEGDPITRISVKAQQAAGIFHEDSQQFSKLDASYKGISIESAAPASKVTIPEAILRFDMNVGEKGLWTGPGFLELKGIKADNPNKQKSAALDNLKVAFTLDRFDPTAALTYRKRIINLIDQGAFEADQMSPEQTQLLTSAIYEIFTRGMNGFTSNYSITGLTFQSPADTLDSPPETFHVDTASLAFNLGGFLEDKVNLSLNYGYQGFETSTLSRDDKDIAPSKANFDINIQNIPFNQLVKIGQNVVASGAAESKETLQMAGLGLLLKVPALLSTAETSITLRNNYLGNDVYHAVIDGEIIADITATNSATAKAKGTFKGLETLLKKLKAMAPLTNAKNQKKRENLTETLEWLQSIGKKDGISITGNPDYTYEFIMDQAGNMLLNGQDIRTLKKPASGASPSLAPAPQE